MSVANACPLMESTMQSQDMYPLQWQWMTHVLALCLAGAILRESRSSFCSPASVAFLLFLLFALRLASLPLLLLALALRLRPCPRFVGLSNMAVMVNVYPELVAGRHWTAKASHTFPSWHTQQSTPAHSMDLSGMPLRQHLSQVRLLCCLVPKARMPARLVLERPKCNRLACR